MPLTKREAAIISAYTGYLIGEFGDMHEYVDSLPGFKGITTIGFALMADSIREAAKADFLAIEVTDDTKITPADLRELAADEELLWEVGRLAIEEALVEWRDNRRSTPFRNNGFVIREYDRSPSEIIRFGPEMGLKIALLAIADHLDKRDETPWSPS